jgi:transglutaminase-like putative cysteine protease
MPEPIPARVRAWCMAAAAACLLPLLLQVPAPLAWALAALAALGIGVARPWPTLLRLVLLALLGGYVLVSHDFSLGRDTGCAMLASLLALKPFETRYLRDARSLLGFSLFAPFTAFLQDQGPLILALALPAVALQLVALSVLAEQRPGAPVPQVGRVRLRAVGLAVLMGLPLALAGFWLFPRLGSPLWGMPENALGRSGLGDRMTPDEWVELFADDTPALRVRFDGAEPRPQDLYWRGQVLWEFDGQTWSRGDAYAPGDPPTLTPLAATYRYQAVMEPTDRRYLVTLDLPLQAPSMGTLTGDLSVSTDAPVDKLLQYSGTSVVQAGFPGGLSALEERRALALPRGLNPRARALGEQWRRESGGDDIAVLRRGLAWIAEDFSYSLTVPPTGRHAVDEFLFETRVGFCQHFSSSFASLMRSAGIPSRVVLGYSGGYRNRYGDYWIVRKMDAHAWTEVWLRGRGWVRVDPTAAVNPERVLDTVEDLARREALLPDTFAPLRDFGDWVRRGWNDLVVAFDAARQASLLRPLGVRRASTSQLVLAFAIGAGLALGLTLWVLLRGRPKPRDPLVAAWLAFTRRLRRAGLAKAAAEPPSSFGERLAAALPAQAELLRSLSRRYAAWRYAPAVLPPDQKARLIAELRAYRPGPR